MRISILSLLVSSLLLIVIPASPVLAVGMSFPITVIEERNDGSVPTGCVALNNGVNGPPEVSLDLDNDGIADICLGSVDTVCISPVDFDCSLRGGGAVCSLEGAASSFMDVDATRAGNLSDPVGPNFDTNPASINAPLGVPLVVGFQGSSNNAMVFGYFDMQINDVDGTDCSYTFGQAHFDDGDNSILYGDGPFTLFTSIPLLSPLGLTLLAGGLGAFGAYRARRRKQA